MRYDSTTIRNHRKNEIASKQEEAIFEGERVAEYFVGTVWSETDQATFKFVQFLWN